MKRSHQIQFYIEEILWMLLEEGVIIPSDGLSVSAYFRNLLIGDFQKREMLTPEIVSSLITGEPLRMATATYAA